MHVFDTKEEADRNLAERLKIAYANIAERGDTILRDSSRVQRPWFTNGDPIKEAKWMSWVEIITQQMIDDLHALKGFDPNEELEAINAIKDKNTSRNRKEHNEISNSKSQP